jgi:hypothetical protein
MDRILRDTSFANDPFFRNSLSAGMKFADAGQPAAASSRELTVNGEPRPATVHGEWLPAEQITLHESWEDKPPQLKVGEPVTRTITIEAKGLVAPQIPPLSLAQPANARSYPEAPGNQSRTDGVAVYGITKQSVTYIPSGNIESNVTPSAVAKAQIPGGRCSRLIRFAARR